ncbi:MAG: HAMP domain-containing histidine kinase [Rhodobacteraceae bacterium]|nr:HAMP domain-containing histidine kinase [Paracoccaceae bacterium]
MSFFSIAAALVATTYALNDRFYRYFQDRIYAELEQHLEQLATNLSLDAASNIVVAPLLDRRFRQPFSGLYWQVETADAEPVLSRSLWGKSVSVAESFEPGERFNTRARSPSGPSVLVSGWVIVLGEGDGERQVVLAVAIDETEVLIAAEGFRAYLLKWLGLMMGFLIIAAWVQIGIGLSPLKVIHRKVEEVKKGGKTRLSGQFPAEVQPLVEEVNTLLEAHEISLRAARAKASDLAHGLKTPLTVMRVLLHEMEADIGPTKTADVDAQISSMHNFIERELAQVRNDTLGQHQTPVKPVLAHMVASMKKLPRGGELDWQLDLPEDLRIPFDQHDLAELLGNILDNARKWAVGKVIIRGQKLTGTAGSITFEDDGPGVAEAMMEALPSRGKRISGSETGSGLGLAICEDLLRAAGGGITLNQSAHGGLKVEIFWP